MGVICVSDSREGTWHVAGWAFDDPERVKTVQQGKLHSGLILYKLDRSIANRISRAIGVELLARGYSLDV